MAEKGKIASIAAGISIGIAFLALVFVIANQESVLLSYYLLQDYPGFLQRMPNSLLEERVSYFSGKELQEAEILPLWKILYMKKEFYPQDYLSESQRLGLMRKIAGARASGIENIDAQLSSLRYLLGANDMNELGTIIGENTLLRDTCAEITSLQVNTLDSCEISKLIDAKFFCGIQPSAEDFENAGKAISSQAGNCVQHCSEHCFEKVPVYVNGCGKAKNENERYHCLFFH